VSFSVVTTGTESRYGGWDNAGAVVASSD